MNSPVRRGFIPRRKNEMYIHKFRHFKSTTEKFKYRRAGFYTPPKCTCTNFRHHVKWCPTKRKISHPAEKTKCTSTNFDILNQQQKNLNTVGRGFIPRRKTKCTCTNFRHHIKWHPTVKIGKILISHVN